ncbi:MAG: hypothetical protein RIC56_10660 [Pseudomonadales bacterium]
MNAAHSAGARADRLLADLGLDAGMLEHFQGFLGALDDPPAVPVRVLTLCRARVAALHGLAPAAADVPALADQDLDALRRGALECFDAAERAALALVENLCFQPHAMSDAAVQDCAQAFGAEGTVGLMTAIAFADVDCRLRRTLPAAADQN